jgi:hypothetical protein
MTSALLKNNKSEKLSDERSVDRLTEELINSNITSVIYLFISIFCSYLKTKNMY